MIKDTILLFILTLLLVSTGYSQMEKHSLGLRSELPGTLVRTGLELSYRNRLHDVIRLDLTTGLQRAGNSTQYWHLYTGIHGIWNIKKGFSWYIGGGGQFGHYRSIEDNDTTNQVLTGFAGGIAAHLGIEYNFKEFDIPLTFTLDTRPLTTLFDTPPFVAGYGFAFGLFYNFNED